MDFLRPASCCGNGPYNLFIIYLQFFIEVRIECLPRTSNNLSKIQKSIIVVTKHFVEIVGMLTIPRVREQFNQYVLGVSSTSA